MLSSSTTINSTITITITITIIITATIIITTAIIMIAITIIIIIISSQCDNHQDQLDKLGVALRNACRDDELDLVNKQTNKRIYYKK